MPQIFTNAKYTDMLSVHDFCGGSATGAVEEYRPRFPVRRIPNSRVFSRELNEIRERGTLPSVHDSYERRHSTRLGVS
jgi:hypothetical protein